MASRIFNALDLDAEALQSGIRAEIDGEETPGLRMHSFSDCVVISCDATPLGLATMAFVSWRLASTWLSQQFLCRGGITRGKVTHRVGGRESNSSALVFGPAFVEAYVLETEVADVSRIVLSKTVRNDWHRLKDSEPLRQFTQLVCKTDDGPHCIDVFAHLRRKGFNKLGDNHMNEAELFHAALSHHHDESSDHPKTFRKVKWLVDEFNKAIKSTVYAGLTIGD